MEISSVIIYKNGLDLSIVSKRVILVKPFNFGIEIIEVIEIIVVNELKSIVKVAIEDIVCLLLNIFAHILQIFWNVCCAII